MVKFESVAIQRARELQVPPEPGKPYSVPVPGSERTGRTAVYRHYRFPDEPLLTLDPNVSPFNCWITEASLITAIDSNGA